MTCRGLRRPGQANILIVGIGNADRGDDGVGLAVVRALLDVKLDGVEIHQMGGNCLPLLDLWHGVQTVIVIDAVRSDERPGAIYRLDASQQVLPLPMHDSSSHAFGLAHVIELGRSLRQLPPHLIIYGVAGHRFEMGDSLSAEVEQALPKVVAMVRKEVRCQRRNDSPAKR